MTQIRPQTLTQVTSTMDSQERFLCLIPKLCFWRSKLLLL